MIQYDIQALKESIQKCEENIKTFETAIDAERATQKEYRRIIRVLEEKLEDGTNRDTSGSIT